MPDPNALQKLFNTGVVWFAASSEAKSFPQFEKEPIPAPQKLLTPFGHVPNLAAGFNIPEIDQTLPRGGLPFGGFHEFFSAPSNPQDSPGLVFPPCTIPTIVAAEAVKKLLLAGLCRKDDFPKTESLHFDKFLLWIGKACWPTPFILESTINAISSGAYSFNLLQNCLFADPPSPKLMLHCLETALRSPAVATVTAEIKQMPFAVSRKFALIAKRNLSFGILIRPPQQEAGPSSALTRWSIAPAPALSGFPCWRLTLLKCKGAQPLRRDWLLEQRETFIEGKTHGKISLHIPALVGKRSGAPKLLQNSL